MLSIFVRMVHLITHVPVKQPWNIRIDIMNYSLGDDEKTYIHNKANLAKPSTEWQICYIEIAPWFCETIFFFNQISTVKRIAKKLYEMHFMCISGALKMLNQCYQEVNRNNIGCNVMQLDLLSVIIRTLSWKEWSIKNTCVKLAALLKTPLHVVQNRVMYSMKINQGPRGKNGDTGTRWNTQPGFRSGKQHKLRATVPSK